MHWAMLYMQCLCTIVTTTAVILPRQRETFDEEAAWKIVKKSGVEEKREKGLRCWQGGAAGPLNRLLRC